MIIDHDFHIHTNLSVCAKKEATLEMYAQKAKELALKKMAITDHMWDHAVPGWDQKQSGRFYVVQDAAYVCQQRDAVKALDNGITTFLFGCESEYCFRERRPAITPAVAERMEVLLVPNSHTHLTMPKAYYDPPQKHIEYMIDAFMDIIHSDVAPYITAIPHPFLAVNCPYNARILVAQITDDQFKRCFSAAAEKGIALELNPNFLNRPTLAECYEDPIFRMYRIAKECGCKFTVGSDSHCEQDLQEFKNIYLFTTLLELAESDFHPLAR